MGRYIGRIQDYCLMMGDYIFDYIKENQPLTYYQKYRIEVDFSKIGVEGSDKIQIPLSEFGEFKLNKKNYKFHIDWDFKLHKILYDFLKDRNISLIGKVCLHQYAQDFSRTYYLQSDIGEDDIVLRSIDTGKKFEITEYSELEWIGKNGLSFD